MLRVCGKLGLWILLAMSILPISVLSAEDEAIRGIVVDRNDKAVWLGLAAPAQKGEVFNIRLVPDGSLIAQVEVVKATPDPPYVAKAKFKMLVPDAFIPLGAYAEIVDKAASDRDRAPGFESARLGPEGQNPLSLQVGAFFPTDNALEDETSDVWPTVQLSYRVSGSAGVETNIGVAYYRTDDEFTVNGVSGDRDFRVIPVTVDTKVWLSKSPRRGWFGRLGIGAYLIDDKRTVGGVMDDTTVTRFGWQAGLGYESRSGRSAQIYYVDVSKTEFKGIVFTLGARF